MKLAKLSGVVAAVLICAGAMSSATYAGEYSLQPWPKDLYDLDHYYAYKWGIDETPWGKHEKVVEATLILKNIRNWTSESNVLYVDLLDSAPHDVNWYWDDQASGDFFAGQGVDLVTYHDLPTNGQNLIYHFNASQISSFNTFAKDGNFGVTFDPDCHFYNDGVSLCVKTTCVPLPPALLAAAPVAGMAMWVKRRMRRSV